MDKKYIFGLAFAVVLLGSASAVAVRIVLHGKSSVPVKGLTSSAAEQASTPAATQPAPAPSTPDFVAPVEKSVTSISLSDAPKTLVSLFADVKDTRAFRVVFADGNTGYRIEQDVAKGLASVSEAWQTSFKTVGAKSKITEDQALYQAESGGYRIIVVLSRLTNTTTGQSVTAMQK